MAGLSAAGELGDALAARLAAVVEQELEGAKRQENGSTYGALGALCRRSLAGCRRPEGRVGMHPYPVGV